MVGGGGIGFYISNQFKFKIIHELSPFYENELECLTIEITSNGKKPFSVISINLLRAMWP
jgi:hypothetical protein